MIIMAIEAMESDDDKAFILYLYNDYYGMVKKTVYNITHDVDQLEDLTNDVFVNLMGKIALLRTLGRYKVAAYVVYTSRSVAINFIKRRDLQNKYIYSGKGIAFTQKSFTAEDGIEAKLILQEEVEEMRTAILKLPEKYKDILYFKYILDMSDREIAGIFRIAPDSVRQYLTRARREARALIDKEMNRHGE